MRRSLLPVFALVGCGGNASYKVAATPPPPAPVASAPPSVDAGGAAITATPRTDCWAGEGDVFPAPVGSPIPPVASRKSYPLFFPALPNEEKARREEAFSARYPERAFRVDEVGVVREVTLTRMPCDVFDELKTGGALTMKTYATMTKFTAELEREMADVVGLAHFGAVPIQRDGKPVLVLREGSDIPAALASALPKELDDAALVARYAGARVRWTKTVRRDVVVRRGNPCLRHRGPEPCDPPGNTVERVEHPVLGERPFGKRYLESFERKVILVQREKGLELRQVAIPSFDYANLAKDLFGSENSVKTEGENEILLTGALARDVVTGEPVAMPR